MTTTDYQRQTCANCYTTTTHYTTVPMDGGRLFHYCLNFVDCAERRAAGEMGGPAEVTEHHYSPPARAQRILEDLRGSSQIGSPDGPVELLDVVTREVSDHLRTAIIWATRCRELSYAEDDADTRAAWYAAEERLTSLLGHLTTRIHAAAFVDRVRAEAVDAALELVELTLKDAGR